MEDDQDELLQCSDEESLSENEDNCIPVDQVIQTNNHKPFYQQHTKLEFLLTKSLLILSTTAILILLPLYIDSVNISGNVFSLILTNTSISTIIIISVFASTHYYKYRSLKIVELPLKYSKIVQLSVIYCLAALAIVYSLDRKHVLCHLQDPIKGIVLVFSLLYYFFFCRKFMGLQRIFSATTIIVGLFIAVDYGLCDEFKCRGYARKQITDDTGVWSWHAHSAWTAVYIGGLALFAAYFNLFERFLITANDTEPNKTTQEPPLLQTVSSNVSQATGSTSSPLFKISQECKTHQRLFTLRLSAWLHLISLFFICATFWISTIPSISKGTTFKEFINYTLHGVSCHFEIPTNPATVYRCGYLFWISWPFVIAYILYIFSSIKFLILSQSAIYTIAAMSASLPIVGIWWSLFYATPSNGILVWSPSFSGELICALLGLPIILIGLFLLCKAHFKDLFELNILKSNHLA